MEEIQSENHWSGCVDVDNSVKGSVVTASVLSVWVMLMEFFVEFRIDRCCHLVA